jgi:hypothetical protein
MAWTHRIVAAARSAANKANIEVTVEWTNGSQVVVTKPFGNDLSPERLKPILRNQQRALEESDAALSAWTPVLNSTLDLALTPDEQAAADRAVLEQEYNAKLALISKLQREQTLGIAVPDITLTTAIAEAETAKAALT